MNKILRMKMVKAMEFLVRHCNNEELIVEWLEAGVADGDIPIGQLELMAEDESLLYTYVDEDKDFAELMRLFLETMHEALKDGGLYCDGVCSSSAWKEEEHEERAVNTKVSYMYRDASNYKIFSEEIVSGSINEFFGTEFDEVALAHFKQNCLIDGEYFYPTGVGLPDNNFQSDGYAAYADDPDWSEFIGFEETKLPPTVKMSIGDLINAFARGAGTLPF